MPIAATTWRVAGRNAISSNELAGAISEAGASGLIGAGSRSTTSCAGGLTTGRATSRAGAASRRPPSKDEPPFRRATSGIRRAAGRAASGAGRVAGRFCCLTGVVAVGAGRDVTAGPLLARGDTVGPVLDRNNEGADRSPVLGARRDRTGEGGYRRRPARAGAP